LTDKIREQGFYHTRIKDWPEDERPREKLLKRGAAALSDAELLAIILRAGTGTITALDLAKSLLVRYKNLTELSGRDNGEFRQLRGIGGTKAATLAAAFEIGRRIAAGREPAKFSAQSPQAVAEKYIPLLKMAKQEEFRVILLDAANRIIRDKVITRGSLNASIVHPREVFRLAITESAAAIIVLHNHPSGNTQPSSEDRKITDDLVRTGSIIGIKVLDHIIVAGDSFYSFADNNEFDAL